jgi:hypothetical protein
MVGQCSGSGRHFRRVLVALLLLLAACSNSDHGRRHEVAEKKQGLGPPPDTSCTARTFSGSEYWFCSNHRSWTTARAKCQAVGLDLIRVETATENAFVKSHISTDWWIGANDRTTEGSWTWTIGSSQFWSGDESGSPVGGLYNNWSSGEPDGLGSEDCAQINGTGSWQEDHCDNSEQYICEIVQDLCPADPNKTSPGVCGCGTPDTDSDGDGTPNCNDACPNDPARLTPGNCGCANAPAPAGTPCNDGLCPANDSCDGSGTCGNPADCAPENECTLQSFQGTSYWFCRNDKSWNAARAKCQAVGMDLTQVDSEQENAFVEDNLAESSFIGATDSALEGTWRWIFTDIQFWAGTESGGPVGGAYSNWDSGQPDAGDSSSEDCAAIDLDGDWSTRSCTSAEAYVCERPRLNVTVDRSLPPGTFGDFGLGTFAPDGSLLVATRTNMIRVPVGGAATKLLPDDVPRRFRIDRASGRWGYYGDNTFRFHEGTGALIAEHAITTPGMALFVPASDTLAFVLSSPASHDGVLDRVRVVQRSGATVEFATPAMSVAQAAPGHVIYATPSELVKATLGGIETWRIPLALRHFEVSADGRRLIGVRVKPGSRIVHVDLATATVSADQALSSPASSVVAAPGGRFTLATSHGDLYLFSDGALVRRVPLAMSFFSFADLNDTGEVVVGGARADQTSKLLFLGADGTQGFTLAGGTDDRAYRPFVGFRAGTGHFFAVRKEGLTSYTVTRSL